jgi:spore maturation protein CgeB
LWNDRAARERLAQAAYEGVRAHYTIAHSTGRLIAVYESITNAVATRASKGAVLRDSA